LYFAGHGENSTGSLVLSNDVLSSEELLDYISSSVKKGKAKGIRGLSLMLDSCYSGAFLIDTILEIDKNFQNVKLYDVEISSRYNEKSWELSFLEHGAFTYSFLNRGNGYVNQKELSKAIDNNNHGVIAKYMQGSVGMMACPVAYLTQGKQHAISGVKGCFFGGVDISEYEWGSLTKDLLLDLFDKEVKS
jgi:hypothetical protein